MDHGKGTVARNLFLLKGTHGKPYHADVLESSSRRLSRKTIKNIKEPCQTDRKSALKEPL